MEVVFLKENKNLILDVVVKQHLMQFDIYLVVIWDK